MKIWYEHLFGKLDKQDIQVVKVWADPQPQEYEDALAQGFVQLDEGWQQVRAVRINISKFIDKCKNFEDENGFLNSEFYDLKINQNYQFFSGPFSNTIFKIIELQKTKINIMIGNLKTTIKTKEYLFKPI